MIDGTIERGKAAMKIKGNITELSVDMVIFVKAVLESVERAAGSEAKGLLLEFVKDLLVPCALSKDADEMLKTIENTVLTRQKEDLDDEVEYLPS